MVQYRTSEEILQKNEELKIEHTKSVSWAAKSKEVQKFIEKNWPKDSTILDIGCGGGHFLKFLKENGYQNIYGFDIDNYVVFDDIKNKISIGDLNFEKIDFEKEKFDFITAFQVMEHLENPFHFERECVRLLRPGGVLILSIPSGKSIWSRFSYLMNNNITGYDLINNHITFLTRDVFEKHF